MKKWFKRLLVGGLVAVLFFFLLILPVGGSFLITNSRFRFPEPGPTDPEALGLTVESVEFTSADGIPLKGWWNPGQEDRPVLIFVHGLNRSRLELLERAVASAQRGYGVLLFDLRNHGESGDAYSTLGVKESEDVCAAKALVETRSPSRSVALWGVSLGASTALLAARRCAGFGAVIADSSFLSLAETVSHHFRLIFGLPSFPIANMIIGLTRLRMGFALVDGDVESAVRESSALPILFIAGNEDRRMPPALARRLYDASANPRSELLIVRGARHGGAFRVNRNRYLETIFDFLGVLDPASSRSQKSDGSCAQVLRGGDETRGGTDAL